MSRIFCPFHLEEEDRSVDAEWIRTYDEDGRENGVGIIEMNEFQCTEDPTHIWHHPSKNYWLRSMGWGINWPHYRDQFRGP